LDRLIVERVSEFFRKNPKLLKARLMPSHWNVCDS
jgi:hypothetical protein